MVHPRSSDPDNLAHRLNSYFLRRSQYLELVEAALAAYKGTHPIGCCCLGCSRTEAAMKIKEAR